MFGRQAWFKCIDYVEMNRLLKDYIEGRLDEGEQAKVLAWIESSGENAHCFARAKSEYVLGTFPDTLTNSAGADAIITAGRRHSIGRRLAIAAVALALPVLGAAVYKLASEVSDRRVTEELVAAVSPLPQEATLTYFVNPGVKGVVDLPDGSRVILNSCSSLSCPAQFDSTSRHVTLTGEAYFEVAANPEWPMIIKTGKDISIVVKGTEFNVSCYENDDHFSLTLISGNLELLNERTGKVVKVRPSEEVYIPDSDLCVLRIGGPNIPLNTGWKDGYLVFDNTPLETVIRKIERWYGIQVTVKDLSILDYNFTASFESESATRVLEILRITSGICYKIDGNRVELSR